MSKELIQDLRMLSKYVSPVIAKAMNQAADSLETKAAPVGERCAVSDGWKLVKVGADCVTSGMKSACIGEFSFGIQMTCAECVDCGADSDCPVCGGEVEYTQKITVPWDTCKEIYKAMLTAAPSAPKADEWVSVSERLPEPFTVVALLNIDRWMNTGSCDDFDANWTGAGWLNTSTRRAFWNAIGEPRGLTFDAVTHWMPLPVSPAIAAARQEGGKV